MIFSDQLGEALDELDLINRPVVVHTSMRSFGEPVQGGADAIIDTLLARGCTVIVPAFTEAQFGVTPPLTMRPRRNGLDYTAMTNEVAEPKGTTYNTDCRLINPGMGTVPATLISRPHAQRGMHPLNSFAAVGAQAAEIISAQSPTDVYGPLRELADRDGAVLMIGVGLNRMSALHLAEHRAGRRLFIRWASRPDGQVAMVEVGSCSEGFPRLEPALRSLARTTRVGASRWFAYPAKETLRAATAAITEQQSITHCANEECLACRDSIAGGPIGPAILG